jgi:hypothetical protein
MLRAYVDYMQGESARVLVGDEDVAISIPIHQLPPGTKQGTVLRVNLNIDQAATNARAKARAQSSES